MVETLQIMGCLAPMVQDSSIHRSLTMLSLVVMPSWVRKPPAVYFFAQQSDPMFSCHLIPGPDFIPIFLDFFIFGLWKDAGLYLGKNSTFQGRSGSPETILGSDMLEPLVTQLAVRPLKSVKIRQILSPSITRHSNPALLTSIEDFPMRIS